MLRLLYGYYPSEELDSLSAAAQQLASDAAKMLSASSRILDIVPICMYIVNLIILITRISPIF